MRSKIQIFRSTSHISKVEESSTTNSQPYQNRVELQLFIHSSHRLKGCVKASLFFLVSVECNCIFLKKLNECSLKTIIPTFSISASDSKPEFFKRDQHFNCHFLNFLILFTRDPGFLKENNSRGEDLMAFSLTRIPGK